MVPAILVHLISHLLSDYMVSEIHQMCGLDTVSVSIESSFVWHLGRRSGAKIPGDEDRFLNSLSLSLELFDTCTAMLQGTVSRLFVLDSIPTDCVLHHRTCHPAASTRTGKQALYWWTKSRIDEEYIEGGNAVLPAKLFLTQASSQRSQAKRTCCRGWIRTTFAHGDHQDFLGNP